MPVAEANTIIARWRADSYLAFLEIDFNRGPSSGESSRTNTSGGRIATSTVVMVPNSLRTASFRSNVYGRPTSGPRGCRSQRGAGRAVGHAPLRDTGRGGLGGELAQLLGGGADGDVAGLAPPGGVDRAPGIRLGQAQARQPGSDRWPPDHRLGDAVAVHVPRRGHVTE